MTKVHGLLETPLYVHDLDRSEKFYTRVFGLEVLFEDDRLRALGVGGKQVLLLFRAGGSTLPLSTPGGTIPDHDGHGPLHIAFSVGSDDMQDWENRLLQHDITIESRVRWPRGGTSIYFRDPDNNSLELATPGTWSIY